MDMDVFMKQIRGWGKQLRRNENSWGKEGSSEEIRKMKIIK